MLQVNLVITPTPLPDNDVWFINSAAWTAYWGSIPATASISPAATAIYVPQPFNAALPPTDFVIDGVDNVVPSIAQFNSLLAQVTAVDQCLQDLRTQLKAAGLISNAQ